ncbi:Uncharacterised protein [uncultured archaeon]|nr:Uncharacterised protein [uncultured archaeon]
MLVSLAMVIVHMSMNNSIFQLQKFLHISIGIGMPHIKNKAHIFPIHGLQDSGDLLWPSAQDGRHVHHILHGNSHVQILGVIAYLLNAKDALGPGCIRHLHSQWREVAGMKNCQARKIARKIQACLHLANRLLPDGLVHGRKIQV